MTRVGHRRLALILPSIFAAWTLFVWIGRLRNLAGEPGSMLEEGGWSLVASVAFTVLGGALVVALVADRRPARSPGPVRWVLAPLVVVTTVVWVVRGIDIAAGDHGAGFIIVHVVLAVVSITLAVAAWWSRRPGADDPAQTRSSGGSEGAGAVGGRLPSKRWVNL